MNRRQLLQALGLTAGSLFLPSLGLACGTTPVRRILFYITNHGTVYDNWKMRPGGLPEDQDWVADLTTMTQAEFSPILAPLSHHASKLLVLDGLAHCPSIVTATNEHDEGNATCLTGDLPVTVAGGIAVSSGPSLDQIIGANKNTAFRSLEYSLRGGWSTCFNASGQRIPMEGEPLAGFNRLFGTAGPGTGGPTTTAERVAMRQSSVLDAAAQRFSATLPTLGMEDRAKLELHRDLIRDLETQLQTAGGLTCDPQVAPGGGSFWSAPAQGMAAFQQLAAAAFSCGLTDVVTLRAGDIRNEDIGAPAGNLHNDFAHNTHLDPGAAAVMTDFHIWYAQRFAELLDLLDSIPEGGGTLLDNTLVVWTNELSTGNHHHSDMPIVLAGGTGVLNPGRIVRWAPQHEVQGPWGTDRVGAPHNRLLVTLANAMGDSRNQVGVSSVGLAGGGSLDCTGPLDRICV